MCNVEGCTGKKHAHGYCGMHAARFRRTGDPLKTTRTGTLESFWKRVDKTDDCWVWTGYITNKGYGQIATRRKPTPSGTRLAHRVAYELLVGEIEEGMHLDHLCRNTLCVNPDHLEPVTPQENTRRGLHGELRTHCNHGHELSGDNVIYDSATNCRRCRACSRKRVKEYAARSRVGNEGYNKSRRKPCMRCGGEKGPGPRKKLCDTCAGRGEP